MRNLRLPEQRVGDWKYREGDDEEADATVGEHSTSQDHRHGRARLSKSLDDAFGDRQSGAAVVHELAEYAAQQEQREEIPDEIRRGLHERQRPLGQHRLSRK